MDADVRSIERSARATGDPAETRRLVVAQCRAHGHLPPAHEDDEAWEEVRAAGIGGTVVWVTWTCPRCWRRVEEAQPSWWATGFDVERSSVRDEHHLAARRQKHPTLAEHVVACVQCQAHVGDDYAGVEQVRPPCGAWGMFAWSFEGSRRAAEFWRGH